MVDQWPSRLQPHHPSHQQVSHDEREGIAALAPQFDTAVPNSRRSVPPIGSASPRAFHFPTSSKLSQQQSPALFNPHPSSFSPSLSSPILFSTSDPLHHQSSHSTILSSPLSNHQDLLLNLNSNITNNNLDDSLSTSLPSLQNSTISNSTAPHTIQIAKTIDFDNYDFGAIDLGPPVFETQSSIPINLNTNTTSSSPSPPSTNQPFQILSPNHIHTSQPQHQHQPLSTSITSPSSSILRNQSRDFSHETRCVMIRNLPPGVDDDKIRALMLVYGPLRDLSPQQRAKGGRGSILATYYDLRHSRNAVHALDATIHFGRRLDVRFHNPTDPNFTSSSPQLLSKSGNPNRSTSPLINQGTLVVFNLDTSISGDEIRNLFSSIGDVKEIRTTPNKKHHRFVEFFDVRDAERAMKYLNKTEVGGKRIKIEISRPGGRSNALARANTISKFKGISSIQSSRSSTLTNNDHSQKYYEKNINKSSMIDNNSNNVTQSNQISTSPIPNDDAQLSSNDTFSLIPTFYYNNNSLGNTNGSNLLGTSLDSHLTNISDQLKVQKNESESFDFGNTRQELNSSLDHLDQKAIQRTSEPSINKSLIYGSNPSVWNRGANASKSFQSSNAPESYIQALYKTQSANEGQTRGSLTHANANKSRNTFAATVNHNDLNERNQRKLSNTESNTSPVSTRCGIHDDGANTIRSTTVRSPSSSERSIGHGSTSNKHGSHGGYAASNFNHNGSQQNSSRFLLDIEKVRSGEETRTALMIRNIPNKYNQKMLLSALEEHHKGHFDFVYLPIDFKNKCNVGYAFINFTKVKFIEPFYDAFHGKKWGKFNSEKICEITFARIQGRQQLLAHFQNSSLLFEDPKCRPVIFDEFGRQEEFPVGSNVRTRRGPSSRDNAHKGDSHAYSPTKGRGRH